MGGVQLLQGENDEMLSWVSSPSQDGVNPSSHLPAPAQETPREGGSAEPSQATELRGLRTNDCWEATQWLAVRQLIARTVCTCNVHS